MNIMLYGILLVGLLLTSHLMIMKRRKTFNLLRMKRMAGNIRPDESVWLEKHPKAYRTTGMLLSSIWWKIFHFPTLVRNRIQVIQEKKARAKRTKDLKTKRIVARVEGSIEGSKKAKFHSIVDELQDPTGISKSKTDEKFLTDPKEEIVLDNIPPKAC